MINENNAEKILKQVWIGPLLAILSFLIYFNTLNHGFVLDDISVISENRYVTSGLSGIKEIWTSSYRDGYWNDSGTLYRPLSQTIFAVLWELAPNNPTIGHFTNVLLYSLLVWLAFYTLKSLTQKPLLAFITSLLFATTALHTEVVANIKSLDEILSLIGAIAAWFMILKYTETKKIAALFTASLCFGVAMFSKEGAISFVAIIPISLWLLKQKSMKALTLPVISLAIPTVAYLATRTAVLGEITASIKPATIDNPMVQYSLFERILTSLKLVGLYLQKLVVPHPLAYEYAFDAIEKASFSDFYVYFGFLILISVIFFAIKLWKTEPIISFSLVFLMASMVLYTNSIVLIGAMFAERFAFVASLGFYLLLSALLLRFTSLKTTVIVGLIIAFFYASLTINRNPVWKSSYELYAADIQTLDNSCKAHYNFGLEVMKQKAMSTSNQSERNRLLLQADRSFERALEIKPGYHLAKSQRALVQYRLKNYEQAIELYEIVLEGNDKDHASWNNLAGAYVSTQQYQKAIESYKKAISINPNYLDALGNCGAVNGMIGNHQEAIYYLEKAHQLAPNNLTYIQYLGMSHDAMGNYEKAKEYSELYGKVQKR